MSNLQNNILDTIFLNQKIFYNGLWIPIPDLIWSESDEPSKLSNFEMLKICQCCERHRINKPTSMHMGWVETKCNHSKIGNPGHECECECRHLMRFMARQYNI